MNWIFIGLSSFLILSTLALIANSLFKKRRPNTSFKNADVLFLKDQLGQLDKEVKLGIIDKSEAEFNKVKISRKILDFANDIGNINHEHSAPITITAWIWCSIAMLVSLGTYKTYDLIGSDAFITRAIH